MNFGISEPWTDPASELAELTRWLVAVPRVKQPGSEVLAKAMTFEPSTAAYHDAIASAVDRAETLHALVDRLSLTSSLFTAVTKAHLQAACSELATVFSPLNLARPWTDGAGSIPSDLATRFEFGGAMVSQFVRLKVYPEEARLLKIEELEQELARLDEPPGPQSWHEMSLRQGMKRLLVMLRAFTFFGHEAVESEARAVGYAAYNAALQAQSNGDERAHAFKTITATVASIMAAVTVINTADDTLTSLAHLSQWAAGQDPYGFVAPTKKLAPPAAK